MNILVHNYWWKPLSLLALVVILGAGCKVNPVVQLDQKHANVTFSVNWKNISTKAQKPGMLKLWIYPAFESEQGTKVIEIPTNETVSIVLEAGKYNIVAYNSNDLKSIVTNGHEDFQKHGAYLVHDDSGGTNIVPQADYLHTIWGTGTRTLQIAAGIDCNIEIIPQTATKIYNVNMDVTSMREFKNGMASLQGVKTSLNFSSGTVSADRIASVMFPISVTNVKKTNTIVSSFIGTAYILGVTSGLDDGLNAKNVINVEFTDAAGAKEVVKVDVTDEIKENPSQNLDLIIKVDYTLSKPEISVTVKAYDKVDGGSIVINPVE